MWIAFFSRQPFEWSRVTELIVSRVAKRELNKTLHFLSEPFVTYGYCDSSPTHHQLEKIGRVIWTIPLWQRKLPFFPCISGRCQQTLPVKVLFWFEEGIPLFYLVWLSSPIWKNMRVYQKLLSNIPNILWNHHLPLMEEILHHLRYKKKL